MSRGLGIALMLVMGCGSVARDRVAGDADSGGEGGSAGEGSGSSSGGRSDVPTCRDPDDYGSALLEQVPKNLPCGALGDLSHDEGVILDIGHETPISQLYASEDRLLSRDSAASWILWDLDTRQMLGRGTVAGCRPADEVCDASCGGRLALAGDVMAVGRCDVVELRSARDSSLLATVPYAGGGNDWGLATDGSYVWIASRDHVDVRDLTGALLASADGEFDRSESVFAAPDALRIPTPPRNGGVMQTLSVETGELERSVPFSGNFKAWFADGARFLASEGAVVRIYSNDVVTKELEQTLTFVGELGGAGDSFWNFDHVSGLLQIRTLEGPGTVVYDRVFDLAGVKDRFRQFGNTVAVLGAGTVEILEVFDSGVESSVVELPVSSRAVFTADAAGHWFIGDFSGVVHTSSDLDRPLSCGNVTDIAGSSTGVTAVATAGGVLLFQLTDESRRYLGSVPRSGTAFLTSRMELSSDGAVLAVATELPLPKYDDCLEILEPAYLPGHSGALRVLQLPELTELAAWDYGSGNFPRLNDFSMSPGGRHVARVIEHEDGWFTKEVSDLEGRVSLTLRARNHDPPRLSPDGSGVAAPTILDGRDCYLTYGTDLYDDGALVAKVRGYPLLWIDDDRLLVGRATDTEETLIYGARGKPQPAPPLPGFVLSQLFWGRLLPRVVSATEVQCESGPLYSLVTGQELWSCSDLGAAFATPTSGDYVVRDLGLQLALERIRR